jgi:hypothetical protein
MQLMVSIYEFPRGGGEPSATPYPKRFAVDYVRGYRPGPGRDGGTPVR